MSRKFIFGGSFSGFDADALAFLTAAGITDPTITDAIETLVVDLKDNGLWSKMKAIYPFVGGTAITHKWNLKNPLDTDAAFRLVFNGGVTHNSNGITGNASNAFAMTHLNARLDLLQSSMHLSAYARTASTLGSFSNEITVEGQYLQASHITFRTNNKISGNAYFSAGNDNFGASVSNTLNGYFVGSKISNSLRTLYRNGSSIAVNNVNDGNLLPDRRITILGTNTANFSANNLSLVSIGEGLTASDVTNLNIIVQTFQTTLGRQV
jgi:hypothetical protein